MDQGSCRPVDPPALRRRLAALAARDEADDYIRDGRPEGLLRLSKAVARLLAYDGVVMPLDRLLITSGGQQELDLMVRALVRPGDRVLLERPAYSGPLGVLHAVGAKKIDVPVRGKGPVLTTSAPPSGGARRGLSRSIPPLRTP